MHLKMILIKLFTKLILFHHNHHTTKIIYVNEFRNVLLKLQIYALDYSN